MPVQNIFHSFSYMHHTPLQRYTIMYLTILLSKDSIVKGFFSYLKQGCNKDLYKNTDGDINDIHI